MKQFRQGDVFLHQVRRPADPGTPVPLDRGRVILAYGEVTGHAHAVEAADGVDVPPAQLFETPTGDRFLLVDRPCSLLHDEHGPIMLAPGAYRVVRQREYSPSEIRTVAD